MATEGAWSDEAREDRDLAEKPPSGLLEDPEIKEASKRALAKVREGRARRGKTGDDLLNVARGRRPQR